MIEKIKNFYKKHAWSFWSLLIGILGICYAIYVDFIKIEKPKLSFEILSHTKVLDVKEDISKLEIIYDGENLKEKDNTLRILTVKIVNNGNTNIKDNDYDSVLSLGLIIENGKIAKVPDLLETSNNYLKERLSISIDTLNQIIFNKPHLDKDQFFILKILIISKENEVPKIVPFGKISGITSAFPVIDKEEKSKQKNTFFQKLNFGSFWIHLSRFIYYLLIIVIVSFVIFIPLEKLIDYSESKSKKRKIRKFQSIYDTEDKMYIDVVFDIYLNYDTVYLHWLSDLFSDNEKAQRFINYISFKSKEDKIVKKLIVPELYYEDFENEKDLLTINAIEIIRVLRSKNILKSENNNLELNTSFYESLNEFRIFLKTQ